MMTVKPKKGLGQHFLKDMNVAARIAATLDAYSELNTLEIGPGTGVLTRFLQADRNRRLTVVEIDRESTDYLRVNLPQPQPRIIEGDFLHMSDMELFPDGMPFAVIGNYPYNISSQIFFKILDWKDRVKCCSGMLQREVAERIAAAPCSKTRGILSVLLQAWYDVEYLFTVDEHVFFPPPKVKSGVIRMVRNDVKDLGCDNALFRTVVKTAFGQRRKTLRNSLRTLLPAGATIDGNPLASLRPEQLSVSQFVDLTNTIFSLRL